MQRDLSILIVVAALLHGGAAAADDFREGLDPTARACLAHIEKSEGQIAGLKVVSSPAPSDGSFSILLRVERAGSEPVNIRCQGTSKQGAPDVADITRE